MSAYLIVNIEVTDPVRYAEYISLAPGSIAKFGGKYLARGGRTRKLEGNYDPKRLVILEFESMDRARAWWDSEEYAGPKALRRSAAVTDMILVEGV
jgi:uncharacterized protein (DUF1330 family)